MFTNIAFIGGIHGVGKSTICNYICNETGLTYLSASELIKWKELNNNGANKKVENIVHTQDRLITGLEVTIDQNNKYLLDGHYSLLNRSGLVTKIPVETFRKINPYSLNLIIENVAEIKERLEKRDERIYEYDLLDEMQSIEISYAKELSDVLKVALNICNSKDVSTIIKSLKVNSL